MGGLIEWLAATYKWDLQTIGELTLPQVMLLWFYYNQRLAKWINTGVDFVNNLFGGSESSGSSTPNAPRSGSPIRGPLPKTAYQPLEMVELSPDTMKKAAEYMAEARKNKKDAPELKGNVTTYKEKGMVRKVIEKPKDK